MSSQHQALHDDEGCTLHGTKEAPLPVEEKAHDANQYIEWEYRKIEAMIGRATRIHQSVVEYGGRLMDRILMQSPGGVKHVFYFDVHDQLLASAQTSIDLVSGKPVQFGKPAGPRSRFIVVWNPAYEDGASRYPTIQTFRTAWAARAPQLLERRRIETRETSHPEVLRKCAEWLSKTWGRQLAGVKKLSVIVVSDEEWEPDAFKWQKTAELMNFGFSANGREKPQFCAVCIESKEAI